LANILKFYSAKLDEFDESLSALNMDHEYSLINEHCSAWMYTLFSLTDSVTHITR